MKTKIATILIALLMSTVSFSVFLTGVSVGQPDIVETMFAGGDGSIGDPYQISNITELQNMSSDLNANYTLINDIDATATSGWNSGDGFVPIGNDIAKFNGSLNGSGYNIIDLFIDRPAVKDIGLFGSLNGISTVSNIGLNNCTIVGDDSVGGLVGLNDGTITNSYSTGSASGDLYIGGIAGENYGNITDCYSTGIISGSSFIGGIVGWNGGNIIDCYSTGNFTGSASYIGGIVGRASAGEISYCYSTGDISGTDHVGGIVGDNTGYVELSYCYSTGDISGTDHVGGISGHLWIGDISYCYSTGDISGTDYVGGLFGKKANLPITDCYSTGNVTGSGSYIGGFVGHNYNSPITDCYSTGIVTGSGDYVGGFAGLNEDSTITDSYSIGDVSGTRYTGGFVGHNDGGDIDKCYSVGDVSPAGGNAEGTGGFVGWSDIGTVTASYSTGHVFGNNYTGGFIGRINSSALTNCYSSGNVYGNVDVGGFIGWMEGSTISNSYCSGNSIGNTNVGGFAGNNNTGTFASCFWDTETSDAAGSIGAGSSTGISGNTTVEMKQQLTFDPPWDFTNVWNISETITYPYLDGFSSIVTTEKINDQDSAVEGLQYLIDFYSAIQPAPAFNELDLWDIQTNSSGWLSIDPMGTVSGIPPNSDIGIFYVNATVTDMVGREGYYNYTLTVENTAPVIITSQVTNTNTGTLYSIDYNSTDDPSTTWSLTGNATIWLSIDNNGILSGTPSNAQAGIYNVEIKVDDGNGENTTQIFDLTVNLDTDGDGDIDATDLDDDDDSYPDIWENFEGTNPVDNADVPIDTDNDGAPDGDADNTEAWMDTDDDNDGTPDTSDDLSTDPDEDTDTDGDGTGNNADTDDDGDGWNDTIEIAGGFDPLDNTSVPGDADNDTVADFMDPDFLVVTEYNNQTIPEYHNSTIWQNQTIPEYYNNTIWNNNTVPEYNNNTIWNNGTADSEMVTETPAWAWGAVIAAVVMGVLAVVGFTRGGGGKPEGVEEVPEPEPEAGESSVEEDAVELEPEE